MNELNASIRKAKAKQELREEMRDYEREKKAKTKELFYLRHREGIERTQRARNRFVTGASRVKSGIITGVNKLRAYKTAQSQGSGRKSNHKSQNNEFGAFNGGYNMMGKGNMFDTKMSVNMGFGKRRKKNGGLGF
jgi:hypothetical protein